jgi:Acetyltransferase (GNAT) domain
VNAKVLDTRDAGAWHAALERLPESDIYFRPEYHHAYEANGEGTAYAFVAEADGELLFHPFLLRPIEHVAGKRLSPVLHDIESAYGYTGPLATTADPAFLREGWARFSGWCAEQGVVAEFIRFHPLLENIRYTDAECAVEVVRESVVLRLDCSEEELWRRYPGPQRQHVRKAMRLGLEGGEVSAEEGLADFARLYRETMERVGASARYRFPDAYFEELCRGLGEGVRLFAVRDGSATIAAAMFLVGGRGIHFHLGGSSSAHRHAAPNNLLFHQVASWGRERGLDWLHLGGGAEGTSEDSLLRFKSTISPLRVPVHIGKRVHDREAFEKLSSQWLRASGLSDRPEYFLLYRLARVA